MTPTRQGPGLVLGIFPCSRGFGYALFEGPGLLVDWGVRYLVPGRKRDFGNKARELVQWYRPGRIVAPSVATDRALPPFRQRYLRVQGLERLSRRESIPLSKHTRAEIRRCFARFGARSKDEIARVIAQEFPELAPRVPRARKAWMTEDSRMAIFDAAALVLTSLYLQSVEDDVEDVV